MREIRWTPHAWFRLGRDRAVTIEQVESAVRWPDQDFKDAKGEHRRVAHKWLYVTGGVYLLRVFYDLEDDDTITITSHYRTSQIRRYWRNDL